MNTYPTTFSECACCERAFAPGEKVYDTQFHFDTYGISFRVPLCAGCRGNGDAEAVEAVRLRLSVWAALVLVEASSFLAPATCHACGKSMAPDPEVGRFIDPRTRKILSVCAACFSPRTINDLMQAMAEKSLGDIGKVRH